MNGNVIGLHDGFSNFIKMNHDEIYATTPKVHSISKDDEWADETEWDELFQLLSAKEK